MFGGGADFRADPTGTGAQTANLMGRPAPGQALSGPAGAGTFPSQEGSLSRLDARPRVFVTSDLGVLGLPELLRPVQDHAAVEVWSGDHPPSPEELLQGSHEAEGILCLLTDRIDAALISGSPRLRVISSMSVGVDHIDLPAAEARGIAVGHTPGVLTETTADLTWALLLATARRVVEADCFVRAGRWTKSRRWAPDMMLGTDLHGATLGLIGLGAIGQAVARRASGFGMRVLGWTRSGRAVPGVDAVPLEELLAQADFVSVHVALTPDTRDLLDARRIASMKPGAILVNTARGGIVDEPALAAALSEGRLAGAALDVFAEEPLGPQSPLLNAPKLVLAPHVGSASIRTRQRMATLAVENLVAGLLGRPLVHAAS